MTVSGSNSVTCSSSPRSAFSHAFLHSPLDDCPDPYRLIRCSLPVLQTSFSSHLRMVGDVVDRIELLVHDRRTGRSIVDRRLDQACSSLPPP